MKIIDPVQTPSVCFAVCTYNRANRLKALLPVMRRQCCDLPFEILVIDNNSTDQTRQVVRDECSLLGTRIRYIFEPVQGIVAARNRAIEESLNYEFLIFIDDDEYPEPGLVQGAIRCLQDNNADCVGGKVELEFPDNTPPAWFTSALQPYYAALDYGNESFRVKDHSTPIWTSNIAYNTRLFRDSTNLRFDPRFSRIGDEIGGGEDAQMLRDLLDMDAKVYFSPAMRVTHRLEKKRLKRRYLIVLDYQAGIKHGLYSDHNLTRTVLGIPYFMFLQAVRKSLTGLWACVLNKENHVRELMMAAYYIGDMTGRFRRYKPAPAAQ